MRRLKTLLRNLRQILKDALQIAKGYKSEKGKMIAKSMIILWNLLYEQKRGT